MLKALLALCLPLAALSAAAALAQSTAPLEYDLNVPEAVRTQLESDLDFASTLRGGAASPLHQSIFGALSGAVYRHWFFSRIHYVGYDHFNEQNAVAFVQHFFDPEKMVLTQNYVNFSHPQIARLMIFFHEARHSENAHHNWVHQKCPRPFLDENGAELTSIWTKQPLSGMAGCDDTAFGAYGASVVMNQNIATRCTNCSEKVRLDASLYAADQAKRITNQEARSALRSDRELEYDQHNTASAF